LRIFLLDIYQKDRAASWRLAFGQPLKSGLRTIGRPFSFWTAAAALIAKLDQGNIKYDS